MAKVLVVGGTQFIGRHVVTRLLSSGHAVTLMNRGKTSPHLFSDLPQIRADRETDDLSTLPELKQDWDTVIDLCAFYPKGVVNITNALKGRAGRYILCSSLSAYEASSLAEPTPIIVEDSPLRACSSAESVDTTLASYGQRKAECERMAFAQSEKNGIPTVVLRPALVFGAFDHTDRFAYWIWRASRNTPFILPDDGLTITRRTYAPDLAHAFESAITQDAAIGQAYNIAETDPLSFRDTIYWIEKHLGTEPLSHAVSFSSDVLLKEKIKPWVDLPAWIPKTNLLVDNYKSRRELGFVCTPATKAIADATDAFLSEQREPKTGLSLAVEKELLSKLLK